MLVQYFRKNEGMLILFVPALLIVGAILLAFFSPNSAQPVQPPFLDAIFQWSAILRWPWVNRIVTAFVALVAAVLLNRASQDLGLLGRLSNMPLLILTVLYFALPQSVNSPLVWICLLFIVVILRQCVSLLHNERENQSTFNASFITAIIGIIHPFFFVFYFTVLLTLLLSSAFTLRRFGLSLVGFFLPIYFLSASVYLFIPENLSALTALFPPHLSFHSVHFMTHHLLLITIVIIAILMNNNIVASSSTLREKRKWQFEILFFFTAMASIFFGKLDYLMAACLIPAAIILSRTLVNFPKRWAVEALFVALLILAGINL